MEVDASFDVIPGHLPFTATLFTLGEYINVIKTASNIPGKFTVTQRCRKNPH